MLKNAPHKNVQISNVRKNNIIILSILFVFICAVFLFVIYNPLLAQRSQSSNHAGEQRNAEKGLRDNRYFIYYLNTTVSNYGNSEQQNAFRQIIQRDIMSQFLYMKFMFYESFSTIRREQKDLIELYRIFLDQDISSTKKMLDSFAAIVITSKDPLARHYIMLGYREMTSTKTEMIMADNYRLSLYSMRLYKYVKAMKRIKEAKKYGFFAVIRANQSIEDKAARKPFTREFVLDKINSGGIGNDVINYRLAALDAYYMVDKPPSFFDMVWDNPEVEKLEEYNSLINDRNQ